MLSRVSNQHFVAICVDHDIKVSQQRTLKIRDEFCTGLIIA